MNRRSFLRNAWLLPFCTSAVAQKTSSMARRQVFKISINAYSFNKLLNDAIRGRGEGTTLLKVLEFVAQNKCEGFDPTGYFFSRLPPCTSRFLRRFPKEARCPISAS